MVELESAKLNPVFHALGDPTRRKMVGQLAQGELTVSELAKPFSISLAAASKHIKALEHAGLVRPENWLLLADDVLRRPFGRGWKCHPEASGSRRMEMLRRLGPLACGVTPEEFPH